jgi:hypothetical protein
MAKDVSNVHFLSIEVDSSNQPVFVTTDIENNKAINVISPGKVLFKVGQGVVVCFLYNTIPIIKRGLAVGMFVDKFFNSPTSDDVHTIVYLILR